MSPFKSGPPLFIVCSIIKVHLPLTLKDLFPIYLLSFPSAMGSALPICHGAAFKRHDYMPSLGLFS